MTPFGLTRGPRKLLTAAVAAVLSLTLLPALGRCDVLDLLLALIDMAKPNQSQGCGCPNSPCCPKGVCRGAATMPCCPHASGGSDKEGYQECPYAHGIVPCGSYVGGNFTYWRGCYSQCIGSEKGCPDCSHQCQDCCPQSGECSQQCGECSHQCGDCCK